ncbi:MAG: hypothetical protein JSR51_06680 [Proteobacteria bacterium]|nr:hypothetical protein [Pseudomonadota bacterium]
MIANNYRKFPEALALQLVLQWGHRLVWALPRPTTRILRAIRAARSKAFAAAGRVTYPVKRVTPSWIREADKRAKTLGQMVRKAQRALNFDAPKKLNPFAQRIADMREKSDRYTFQLSA